jgi:hypothetical protein
MLQLSNQYVTEVSLPDEPKKNWEGGLLHYVTTLPSQSSSQLQYLVSNSNMEF